MNVVLLSVGATLILSLLTFSLASYLDAGKSSKGIETIILLMLYAGSVASATVGLTRSGSASIVKGRNRRARFIQKIDGVWRVIEK